MHKLSQLLRKTAAPNAKPGPRGARKLGAKRVERTLAALTALMMFSFVAPLTGRADSLLDQLSGHWIGEGERVQLISGSRIRIRTEVQATQEAQTLLSHNELIETRADGSTRKYQRKYWIRQASVPGEYELGVGDQVGSRGRWTDGAFHVEQDLGGGYVIRSRTTIEPMETHYEETFSSGDRLLSQTRIDYRRAR